MSNRIRERQAHPANPSEEKRKVMEKITARLVSWASQLDDGACRRLRRPVAGS
ncbi:hypothetical protein ACF3NS_10130 [Arsenicicoccus cauae]|uniref:Uncharacterized protein n=1 Tax=Arsenicicoccus cauae TaxID=2663847 RepID=A0A6I3I6L0_9MICO|nr:hypothetical protein [Arsenicicoccus cauae]MTB71834.1 hypothetical protein [Arsenicicoccus cauae]